MRSALFIALFAAVTPCMNAQRIASAAPHFARNFNHRGHSRSFSKPLAFYDPFYSDYFSNTGSPGESQPSLIVVQTAPATPAPERPSSPAQPLMIELQGDRYVRLSGEGTSDTPMVDPRSYPSRGPDRSSVVRVQPVESEESAPAILVFRDGHREEISEYAITNGILYIAGDPYTSESWNRKIELSSLNLPETVNSNRSRGIKFQLPSAPNEVIVRP